MAVLSDAGIVRTSVTSSILRKKRKNGKIRDKEREIERERNKKEKEKEIKRTIGDLFKMCSIILGSQTFESGSGIYS